MTPPRRRRLPRSDWLGSPTLGGVTRTAAAWCPSMAVTASWKPLVGDFIAHRGQPPKRRHHEASRGLVRSFRQFQSGRLGELVEVEPTVDLDGAIDQPPWSRDVSVVLVPDVTDDLLDQVLESHDAVGSAVLVDDDGEVVPFPPHLGQRREHVLRARDALHLAHQVADTPDSVAARRRRRADREYGRSRGPRPGCPLSPDSGNAAPASRVCWRGSPSSTPRGT